MAVLAAMMTATLSLLSLVPGLAGDGNAAGARDTESIITSVTPDLPSRVRVDIVGFDSFLRVRSDGVKVEVSGYESEPYIRIEADGTVWVNDRSITRAMNESRYGNSSEAADESKFSTTETEWQKVGTDGTAMWHDHRSHWMSPKPPAIIDARGKIQDWVVPITVNGVATDLRGEMYLRERAGAWWWVFGLLAVIAIALVSLRPQSIVDLALFIVGSLALSTGAWQMIGLPSAARPAPLLFGFGAVAAIAAMVSVFLRSRRSDSVAAPAFVAGAGLSLVIGAWLARIYVQAAYIPGADDVEWIVRILVPVMLAAGIVGVIDGVRRTAFPPTTVS
ncbi:MAG: hypothetical protein LW606_08860 [Ilumatobacteraceae bacterium]|jgi:hypothetical protein|nr:hypothetical protein [Ilumatobacteraceae bacterium]